MKHLFEEYLYKFEPISLETLNARAALLDRAENKYILTPERLSELIPELVENFDILQIEERRIFEYKSLYFDSDELIGYTYHNQERIKRRFKIRTRHYVDSDMCFFEIKLKNKRGGTIKKRIRYALDDYATITDRAWHFLKSTYQRVYGVPFTHDLSPKLEVSCDRITLVHKESSERMTIDLNLGFATPRTILPIKRFVIVEVKSSQGKGAADMLFKKHLIRSRNCSKYCLGINLAFNQIKYNRFKPLLKLYRSQPDYVAKESKTARVNASQQRSPHREIVLFR